LWRRAVVAVAVAVVALLRRRGGQHRSLQSLMNDVRTPLILKVRRDVPGPMYYELNDE
jgi:hypothetical protein